MVTRKNFLVVLILKIQLSDHFTYKRLIRFVAPAICMTTFGALYYIVDGFFVSNYVGKTAFASINIIMPLLSAISTLGFMIGSGGSAVITKTLGEGKRDKANEYFSMMVYFIIVLSSVIALFGAIFIRPIALMFDVEGEILEGCIIYGRIMFITLPCYIMQYTYQCFFAAAEKPKLSFVFIFVSGMIHIALDFVFINLCDLGLRGAAYASAVGQIIGGVGPLVYFASKNSSLLKLTKTKFYGKQLLKSCTNGSSEMVTNLSTSIMNMIYNYQLLRLAGEDGVVAYGAIMYIYMIFTGVFFGYSIGSSPIVGYHYGAKNTNELKNMFKKGLVLMAVIGVGLFATAEVFNKPLIKIFTGYSEELFSMASHGFRFYAIAFIFMGFNIWASGFFTALSNGAVSATISFVRSFGIQIAAIFILPLFMGLDGVWLAIVVAEFVSLFPSVFFLLHFRNRYQYLSIRTKKCNNFLQ